MLMDKAAEDVKYTDMEDENMQRPENLVSAYEALGCVQNFLE